MWGPQACERSSEGMFHTQVGQKKSASRGALKFARRRQISKETQKIQGALPLKDTLCKLAP